MPDQPFKELTTPLVTWNLPSCKEWLKAHGYMNDGKLSVLRENIAQFKK